MEWINKILKLASEDLKEESQGYVTIPVNIFVEYKNRWNNQFL